MKEQPSPSFTSITNWNLQIYTNTTGSRSKKIVINPVNSERYFFKGSKELEDGSLRYPMEFWSEIAASKIGQFLGFDVLDYNVGYHESLNQKVGCLSKSMILENQNRLTEGREYLTGFEPAYLPEEDKNLYTFNFIRKALEVFNMKDKLPDIVKTVVFDSIIGNSDRHQENWGIISHISEFDQEIQKAINSQRWYSWSRYLFIFLKWYAKKSIDLEEEEHGILSKQVLKFQSDLMRTEYSQIYDSGCCLGRELEDDRVVQMIESQDVLNRYVRRGKSEIRWVEGKNKLNHFDLVIKLKEDFEETIRGEINRVRKIYSVDAIEGIIMGLDSNLPTNLDEYRISENRKILMVKLINLRVQNLLRIND